jgi:16S rRNA (cytosine967-C5)-methyltransferase
LKPQNQKPVAASGRSVALDLLMQVEASDAYANLLLPKLINKAGLDAREAGFAQELAFGSLRWQLFYDRVIEECAKRYTDEIDLTALIVLRFGAHQVLGMRVPSHAALSETVELAKSYLSQGGVGFVNGVLRRVTEKDREAWVKIVVGRCETEVEKLAVEYSHPQWIVRALEGALKLDGRGDELTDLLFADNLAPLVNLAALPGLATSSDTVDLLPGRASPIGFELESGDPWNLVGVRDGVLRVQDQGSQLAALLLTQAEPAKPGEQWLDLCAGPGGKAALLAAEARLASATLTANELQPHRAKLVEQALQEVDRSVKVNVGDGALFGAEHPETFDRILLDAPCTGLGALRRRPEARWRKSAEDVGDLTKLQEQLLVGAWAALKPGGILAYVTCSPHQAETNGVVSWAETKFGKAFELLDAKLIMEKLNPELHLNQSRKTIQLWPHIHGTDAMYVALIRKAK